MLQEKFLNFFTTMNGSSIPQQENRSAKMLEEIFEEGSDIQTSEISGANLNIKGQTFPFWGYRQRTDRRDSILFVEMVKVWGLPPRSPSPSDRGNKQKARFIEEDQMGPKFFDVFLYGATDNASNEQSLLPFFVRPCARVSGNSIPGLSGVSRCGMDDRQLRTFSRLPGPLGLESIDPLGNRQPRVPLGAPLPIGSFVPGTAWADAQESAEALSLAAPSPGMLEASERPNSLMSLWPGQRWTDSGPLLADGWLGGAAFPTVVWSPGVSCSIL
jgi:hypothetical protein